MRLLPIRPDHESGRIVGQNTQTNPEKSDHGQQTLDALAKLLNEYGDELRDAIAIVSRAEGEVNTSRSQQISQYHRNRIGKLEKTINKIDEELEEMHKNILELTLSNHNDDCINCVSDGDCNHRFRLEGKELGL